MGKKKKQKKLEKKLKKKYKSENSVKMKNKDSKKDSIEESYFYEDRTERWIRETREKGAEIRKNGRGLYFQMKSLAISYLEAPQETITAELASENHQGAWAFFLLGLLMVFVEGITVDDASGGLRLMLLYGIFSFIYPVMAYLIMGTERKIRFRDGLPTFFTARIIIYFIQLAAALMMLLDFWFFAVILEFFMLPMQLIFDYMGTLALCEGNSKKAVRTTMFSVLSVLLLCLVILFFLLAFSLLDNAVGQLLEGGLDIRSVLEFLLEYM